jgi:hypothetical protein
MGRKQTIARSFLCPTCRLWAHELGDGFTSRSKGEWAFAVLEVRQRSTVTLSVTVDEHWAVTFGRVQLLCSSPLQGDEVEEVEAAPVSSSQGDKLIICKDD